MKKNANLATRYAELKMKVGGNREKQQYEHTMFHVKDQVDRITPPSPAITRILSQVQFALELSRTNGNKYDTEISDALDILENGMDQESVLTKTCCLQAEECLLPLKAAARAYQVIYVGHAHIDMNWKWGWQETVAATLSTFRTMLNLMEEYPEFTFSQSQASVYRIVEEYDPEMMEEIKARIREGRWEVTANAWVETDKNMPDTESLIRHISVTRDYLHKVWDVEPGSVKVDFSPDTFGHSRFVPEINSFGNVPYYYHCRGRKDDFILYRYQGPSGKEIMVYREPYWYNGGVNPDNGIGVFELEKRCCGLKTALIVYGVGNHGGGVTRRDIENVLEMQKWPVFPELKFGTLHEYFEKAEAVRDLLPVVAQEANVVFTGCYTTQSRIKLANRRAEKGLLESEMMDALAHYTLGTPLHTAQYEEAWKKVLFTHFHDILTGSCVQESREDAMARLAHAIATAQTGQAKAYEKLSQAVDTSMFEMDEQIADTVSEGAGVGYGISNYAGVPNPERGAGRVRIYTIFNTTDQPREEMTELTLWDYTGDLKRLEVVDEKGQSIPFQLLDQQMQRYWEHRYVRILIQAAVPAFGYAVYAVREREMTEYTTHLYGKEETWVERPKKGLLLENDYLAASFDTGSGQLISLTDKSSGEEMLSAPAGLTLVQTEKKKMTSWNIGRYLGMEPVTRTVNVTEEKGSLRNSILFQQKVMDSTVQMKVSLDANAKALQYEFNIDWKETCDGQGYIPLLSYRMPLKKNAEGILCDVPAGCVVRKPEHIDVPALTGVCAVCPGIKPAILSDCKYGYRLADNVLSVTLINTAGDPDPYPERGIHAMKLMVALTDGTHMQMKHLSKVMMSPMIGVPTARHEGSLASRASLIDFCSDHSILTGVFAGADGAMILRLYEAEGRRDPVTVTLPFAPKEAVITDLDGEVIRAVDRDGKKISFVAEPYGLLQVKCK